MAESERYRGMGKEHLDVAYNNRAVIPGWETYLARWTEQGQATYLKASKRDLAYGSKPRQRIDVFLCPDKAAPTCLFLHGGYWQWNDKEGQACTADGILRSGCGAAIGEYTLAPDASMTEICEEAIAQVAFLSEELQRSGHSGQVIVCGISTGAQLMACTLDMPCVAGAVLMSGIYDLEPIRLSSLNAPIGMDWTEARRWSPLHHIPSSAPPIVLAHGANERPEICRQTMDYHAALQAAGHDAMLLSVTDTHHFSILDTLIDGVGPVATALKELVSRAGSRTTAKFA